MHANGGIESERGDIPECYPQQFAIFPEASISCSGNSFVAETSQAEGIGLSTVNLFALTAVSKVPYNGGKQQVQTSVSTAWVCVSSIHGSPCMDMSIERCAESG